MLLKTLVASVLTAKSVLRAEKGVVRTWRGYSSISHMDKNFYFGSVIYAISRLRSISVTNLGLMPYFSGDSLPRIKDRVYVINLDDKQRKGTHWLSLFIDKNTAVYFNSFGIVYIPQEVLTHILLVSLQTDMYIFIDSW